DPTEIVKNGDVTGSHRRVSSNLTFPFSEAPGSSFTESDIQVTAGLALTAGSLAMIDATHYTATVTATDGFTGTGTVSLAAGSYTDASGNAGGAGSDSVPIDTANPTAFVYIVDTSRSDIDNSSQATFALSHAPVSCFTELDIQVTAGLAPTPGPPAFTAPRPSDLTVTATDGFTGTGTVSLAAGSYTDASGNAGGAGSDSVSIDTNEADPNDFDNLATGSSV